VQELFQRSFDSGDGGYFDNSGMTTLAEFALVAAAQVAGCSGPDGGLGSKTCPIRIIHLPLGWTLSHEAMAEMQNQLLKTPPAAPGSFNRKQLDVIATQLRSTEIPGSQ
jgi:hypothetical protein